MVLRRSVSPRATSALRIDALVLPESMLEIILANDVFFDVVRRPGRHLRNTRQKKSRYSAFGDSTVPSGAVALKANAQPPWLLPRGVAQRSLQVVAS